MEKEIIYFARGDVCVLFWEQLCRMDFWNCKGKKLRKHVS